MGSSTKTPREEGILLICDKLDRLFCEVLSTSVSYCLEFEADSACEYCDSVIALEEINF